MYNEKSDSKPSKKQTNQKISKRKTAKNRLASKQLLVEKSLEKKIPSTEKLNLHPRNKHRARYDFEALIAVCPALAGFVATNIFGDASIDFANPQAVIALNQALLAHHYNIRDWQIPAQYLCPPIPGRADYIHYLADLLSPSKQKIRALDIGAGANVVYPLIGNSEYGWQFVGADIDAAAIENAAAIIKANNLNQAIELRLQANTENFFKGVVKADEYFDISLCNPPFHATAQEAAAASQRKQSGLKNQESKPTLNFGGQAHELIYTGGEEAFVCNMVLESKAFAKQVGWFTSLISKETTLPAVYQALRDVGAVQVKTIAMAQGQKKSRFVAWTYLS